MTNTLLVPRCKTVRHGPTCCAMSTLSAVVWTDGIIDGDSDY